MTKNQLLAYCQQTIRDTGRNHIDTANLEMDEETILALEALNKEGLIKVTDNYGRVISTFSLR